MKLLQRVFHRLAAPKSAVGAHLHNTIPADNRARLRPACGRHRGEERTPAGADSPGSKRSPLASPELGALWVGTGGVPFNEFLSEPADFWLKGAHRVG